MRIASLAGLWLTLLLVRAPLAAAEVSEVAPAVLTAEQQRIAAIAKATRSAVAVFANGGNGGGIGSRHHSRRLRPDELSRGSAPPAAT
jgi:hypothetical protein